MSAEAAAAESFGMIRSLELVDTSGFLVADVKGRVVGRVHGPMYGSSRDTPDALSVRFGFFGRRRLIVPADSIADVDDATRVVCLTSERDSLRSFL